MFIAFCIAWLIAILPIIYLALDKVAEMIVKIKYSAQIKKYGLKSI